MYVLLCIHAFFAYASLYQVGAEASFLDEEADLMLSFEEPEAWSITVDRKVQSYLGIILSTCCVFSHASSDLAAKAHIGIIGILKVLSLEDCNPFLFFKQFDTQIQPIFL